MTSTELVKTETAMPATFDELSGMAKAFVSSGMFTDVRASSQAIVKVQAGKELGLPPVYSMQNINMIKGRLTTSANTMALLVKRSGRYNYRIVEHTDTVCDIKFLEWDNGKWLEVGHSKFTLDDAKRANLVKPGGSWAMYPRAMLFSRAISQGARLYTPDAIGGVYTTEEMKSVDAPNAEEPWDAPPDPYAGPPDYSNHEDEPPAETSLHWCEEHGREFFKSVNMHSFGHPIDGEYNEKGKQIWCHEHVNKPPADNAHPDFVSLREPFPPGEPGDRLQVLETGDIMEYQETEAAGGGWRVVGKAMTEPPPDESEASGDPPDPETPADIGAFFVWLQTHGRKYGPTWFYKTFPAYDATKMKNADTVAQAFAEVKEIQGW